MIHPTAEVSKDAKIGKNTKVWHQAQIRENAVIGDNCIISKNVYICAGVKIGSNVKIQNNVSVYQGVTIEDGVFVGPHVCFTNDLFPRAINPDGTLKTSTNAAEGAGDWHVSDTLVKYGASIGANSTIVCGVKIGKFALIGAGSVVTKDVPDYGLVFGNPARLRGFVCACANKLKEVSKDKQHVTMRCPSCNKEYKITIETHSKVQK
jgi:acetyltransferase-like isoleucine patch superfamily enzyme